jgi:crotonobetainyl-CoA:carnitine CoA-transferase CaiB-like acyl-CoA transferase
LLSRVRTGEGQYIDTSLFEGALAYTFWESNEYWATGTAPKRLGTAHRLSAPYQVFATANGWIAIGAANQRNWELLVRALERPDLLENPHFASNAERMAHVAELVETLTTTLKTRPTEEWLKVFEEAGVPCGPVLTLDEVYRNPQVKARELDIEVQHPTAGRIHAIGFPVKYSSTPGQMYRPAPVLGQHTLAILESLGYSPEECRQFETDEVILDAHLG